MNSDRVKVLINIYKEKYQDLTQGRIDVRDKWVAVYTCLKNWDIMAEDFGAMFEASMQDAEFLLDHGEVRPTDGIVMLCRGGRTEEVREAFAVYGNYQFDAGSAGTGLLEAAPEDSYGH